MIQITINPKSLIPIFEQIKERLRLLLLGDALAPGDQLPSVRQLAVQLTVNPNTVAKVYRAGAGGAGRQPPRQGSFAAAPLAGGARRAPRPHPERGAGAGGGQAVGLSAAELIAIIQEEIHE